MALMDKREAICNYVKNKKKFLSRNAEVLDIYYGNLLPYVDGIMQATLSPQYYNAIKERIIPINILQRYIDKVSTTYENPPQRTSKSKNKTAQDFVDFYKDILSIDSSGQVADEFANLFKAFAWEPYLNDNGKPCIRELPFDQFLPYSDSATSPEKETIFIKFMGCKSDSEDSLLLHVYSDDEFDAFYLNGEPCEEDLIDNMGLNPIGTIPFVYGKRQKNKLIPTQDTDMLAIGKALSVMLSDAAGAQMFQCFSILYGVDVNMENLTATPNAFWSLKSDNEKKPMVGTLDPKADTEKVLNFVINIFILWLETKGVRVGSIGSMNAQNFASGISKIIDEMDVFNLKKKSMKGFKVDEECLWNEKLPKIHNYWVTSGQIDPAIGAPPIVGESERFDIDVDFGKVEPRVDREKEIASVEKEVKLGTMTLKQAIKKLHPEYTDKQIDEVIAQREIESKPAVVATEPKAVA